jgi:hypothetical protein
VNLSKVTLSNKELFTNKADGNFLANPEFSSSIENSVQIAIEKEINQKFISCTIEAIIHQELFIITLSWITKLLKNVLIAKSQLERYFPFLYFVCKAFLFC